MRFPKLRGFKSPCKITYQVVNMDDLSVFNDGDEVNFETLLEKGLVAKKTQPIKILGDGKLERKLSFKVQKISSSAKKKIAKSGGKVL